MIDIEPRGCWYREYNKIYRGIFQGWAQYSDSEGIAAAMGIIIDIKTKQTITIEASNISFAEKPPDATNIAYQRVYFCRHRATKEVYVRLVHPTDEFEVLDSKLLIEGGI